jgi:WD40 repeat protein
LIRRLTGQKEPIRAMAFSPDGKLLASASEGSPTWLWEIATGKVLRRFLDDPKKGRLFYSLYVRSLAFSPDGKILATGCADHSLYLWEATGGPWRECSSARMGSASSRPAMTRSAGSWNGMRPPAE